MPTYKISSLTAVTSIAGTEELEVNQAGTSKKATRAQLIAGLVSVGAVTASGLTMSADRILGRTTAGTGAVQELVVVPVSLGGTGSTTVPANGRLLIGNGTGYTVANLTAGNNVTITNGAGSITIESSVAPSLLGQTDSASPYETALGSLAGNSNTGVHNTFIGNQAGYNNTTGGYNTAIGSFALSVNTSASNNVAVGYYALQQSTGTNNVAVGRGALNQSTASSQVAVGHNAGLAVTTGGENTLIGSSAGSNITTGTNNTVIGNGATASTATVSNQITLGNSSISTLRCQVTSITGLSDARDKRNTVDLPAGLEFVKGLRPVKFEWNMRDGGKVGEVDTGFIAQDLQATQATLGIQIPGLVYDNNPDRLEANYGKLLPVLVNAIKELSAEVDRLKAQIAKA